MSTLRIAVAVCCVAAASCAGETATEREPSKKIELKAEPSTGGPQQPAPPEPPPLPASGAYAKIAGKWKGTGIQYDNQSWEVEMNIDRPDAGLGERVGRIEYPKMGCGGFLIRERETAERLMVREQLTHGIGRCVDNGTIGLPHAPTGGTLIWRYYMPGSGDEMAMATFIKVD